MILTAGALVVLNFGFDILHLEKIEAFTHRENESSRKLLGRNNFILIEGRMDEDNKNNVVYEIQKGRTAVNNC